MYKRQLQQNKNRRIPESILEKIDQLKRDIFSTSFIKKGVKTNNILPSFFSKTLTTEQYVDKALAVYLPESYFKTCLALEKKKVQDLNKTNSKSYRIPELNLRTNAALKMKYTGYNDVDIRDALTKYFSHTLNRNEKVDEVMRSYDTWDKNYYSRFPQQKQKL